VLIADHLDFAQVIVEHLDSESNVVAWPELIDEPTDAVGFLAGLTLMARHYSRCAHERAGVRDRATKPLVKILAVPVRDLMRVRALFPRALRALLRPA
jgi:hypothetical protein